MHNTYLCNLFEATMFSFDYFYKKTYVYLTLDKYFIYVAYEKML